MCGKITDPDLVKRKAGLIRTQYRLVTLKGRYFVFTFDVASGIYGNSLVGL